MMSNEWRENFFSLPYGRTMRYYAGGGGDCRVCLQFFWAHPRISKCHLRSGYASPLLYWTSMMVSCMLG
jgi:hypothetical protein